MDKLNSTTSIAAIQATLDLEEPLAAIKSLSSIMSSLVARQFELLPSGGRNYEVLLGDGDDLIFLGLEIEKQTALLLQQYYAAVEMMDKLTRRHALQFLAIGATSAAVPAFATEQPMSAEERRDYHLAEFKRACEELEPMIGHWSEWRDDDDGSHRIVAHILTGRYDGDGVYEAGQANALGRRGRWTVRRRVGKLTEAGQ